MDESNSNVVVRLVAQNQRTRRAWEHPHNKKYYVPASFQDFPIRSERSRQTTPSDPIDGASGYGGDARDTEPELRIDIGHRPKSMSKGWVFGSDRTVCDIYCGEHENNYNIGSQTFSITISKQNDVILKHFRDTNRTQVQYDSQEAGDRQEFVWIMFPYCDSILVTSAYQLSFKVIVATPSTQTESYRRLRAQFIRDVNKSMKIMPPSVKSKATTAHSSLVHTPNAPPFYYVRKDRFLGSGSSGEVYIVVDVSTGIEYAGKTFFRGVDQREVDTLAKQNHENILKFVTLSNDDGPLLVTEYLPGGSLARPWRIKDQPHWNSIQVASILIQCLRGLASLHARPNSIIHRDIKPENIMVAGLERVAEPPEPGPWIKLADFGLAAEVTMCNSHVGTYLYLAPEVFSARNYDTKVDIWSLGVVIAQLCLEGNVPHPLKADVQNGQWCEAIIRMAKKNWFSCCRPDVLNKVPLSLATKLWQFIALYMLVRDPSRRLSAQACLDHPNLLEIQSCIRSVAALRRRITGQQARGASSNSTVQEEGGRVSETTLSGSRASSKSSSDSTSEAVIEQELSTKPIFNCPSAAIAPPQNSGTPIASFDPGVPFEEAIKVLESKGSKTAKPPQASRPENEQRVGTGMVREDGHDNEANASTMANWTPADTELAEALMAAHRKRMKDLNC